jgi:hypothetical protein
MGNRLAKRAFGRLFDINVNPLMIVGALGELVDPFLIDQDPIAHPDPLTHQTLQLFDHSFPIHETSFGFNALSKRPIRFRAFFIEEPSFFTTSGKKSQQPILMVS